MLAAVLVAAAIPALADPGQCPGGYDDPVVNLCDQSWPPARSDKVWLVLFYAPWCGHCQALEPKYHELASQYQDELRIGIGAIDCSEPSNRGRCMRYNIVGYPTIKVIISGQVKPYEGPRDTTAMKDWLAMWLRHAGAKRGADVCPRGIFESKTRDAVVPLCEAYFPGSSAKHEWLIIYYDGTSGDLDGMRDAANRVAEDLGNEPPTSGGPARRRRQGRHERLLALAERYQLKLKPRGLAMTGTGPLAKIGGVCCDCPVEGQQRLCDEASRRARGPGNVLPPRRLTAWLRGGRAQALEFPVSPRALVVLAMRGLGVLAQGAGARGSVAEL